MIAAGLGDVEIKGSRITPGRYKALAEGD